MNACRVCGAPTPLTKCNTCLAIAARLRELKKSISSLNSEECDELADIIHFYMRQDYRGYKGIPKLDGVRRDLQKHAVDIGKEKYPMYGLYDLEADDERLEALSKRLG